VYKSGPHTRGSNFGIERMNLISWEWVCGVPYEDLQAPSSNSTGAASCGPEIMYAGGVGWVSGGMQACGHAGMRACGVRACGRAYGRSCMESIRMNPLGQFCIVQTKWRRRILSNCLPVGTCVKCLPACPRSLCTAAGNTPAAQKD